VFKPSVSSLRLLWAADWKHFAVFDAGFSRRRNLEMINTIYDSPLAGKTIYCTASSSVPSVALTPLIRWHKGQSVCNKPAPVNIQVFQDKWRKELEAEDALPNINTTPAAERSGKCRFCFWWPWPSNSSEQGDQTRLPCEFVANPFSGSRDISYTNKKVRQLQKKQNLM